MSFSEVSGRLRESPAVGQKRLLYCTIQYETGGAPQISWRVRTESMIDGIPTNQYEQDMPVDLCEIRQQAQDLADAAIVAWHDYSDSIGE